MFPYKICSVDEATQRELMFDFRGEKNGFCQVGPKKWIMPLEYEKHAKQYYNLKLRKDDIWIVTYPRSGTTWTQELLWVLNNDLDYKRAAEIPLDRRFPFLELNSLVNTKYTDEIINLNKGKQEVFDEMNYYLIPGYEIANKMESPRHIKTHLPLSLLPPDLLDTCKVVYLARNPKDVAVSFYHHNRLFTNHNYVGDFAKYWDYFEKDLLLYSPYWDHLQEAWEKKIILISFLCFMKI